MSESLCAPPLSFAPKSPLRATPFPGLIPTGRWYLDRIRGRARHGSLEPNDVTTGGLDMPTTICQYHFDENGSGIRFGNWSMSLSTAWGDPDLDPGAMLVDLFREDGWDDADISVSCINHETVHWLIHVLEGEAATRLYDTMFWTGVTWVDDGMGGYRGVGSGSVNVQMWETVHIDGSHVA